MIDSKKIKNKRELDEKKIEKIIGKNSILLYNDIIAWLYKNHKKVLREYEATKGNLRVEFAGSVKG